MPETVITARAREYADGDVAFAAWLSRVDAACERRVGLSVFDFADFGFRDAFEDGRGASSVAAEIIRGECS